jgi:hypothetical protein
MGPSPTVSRGIVSGPQPSSAARRFATRLRFAVALRRAIRGFDFRDFLTVLALGGIFAGLALPSMAFGVTGGLLLLLTPIGDALRLLIRGK